MNLLPFAAGGIFSKDAKKLLFGTKDKVKQLKTQSPEQEQLTKLIIDALQTGQGPFSDLFKEFDQNAFDEGVSKPALKNFEENVLPFLQEKFTAGGYQGTPMAAREIGKAGAGLQSTLANLLFQARQAHQQSSANSKLGLTGAALGVKPFENIYQQGDPGLIKGFLQGGGANIAKMAIAG